MAIGILDRDGDLGTSSLLDDAGQPVASPAAGTELAPAAHAPAAPTAHDLFDGATPALAARRASEGPGRHSRPRLGLGDLVALVALLVVLVEVCAGLLPEEPTIGYFTPLRMVLALGLAAAALTTVSHRSWGTPLDGPVAVLILAAIPAARIAGDFSPWRWLITYLAFYYLVVFVARRVHDLRESMGLLGLAGVAIASFQAITQAAEQESTGMCRSLVTGTSDCDDPTAMVRVIGTFSNPNTLGAFLVLALPFAALYALAAKRTTARAIGWGVVGAGLIALFFTFSRGPLLAVIFGALAYAVLRRPGPRRLRIAGIATAAGAVLFILVGLVAPDSVGVRWEVWRAALVQALRNPFGVGLQSGGEAIQDHIGNPDEAYLHAHNLWLNMWLELGWLGLLASIAITWLAAKMVLRLVRDGSALAPALGAALAGFAVASLVDHSANTTRLALALAAVLAVLAAEYGAPRPWKGIVTKPLDVTRTVPIEPTDSLLEDE